MKNNYFLRWSQYLLLLLTLLFSLSTPAEPLLNNHHVDKRSLHQCLKNSIVANGYSFYNSKEVQAQPIQIKQDVFLHTLLIATKKQSSTNVLPYVYNANLQFTQIVNTAITSSTHSIQKATHLDNEVDVLGCLHFKI